MYHLRMVVKALKSIWIQVRLIGIHFVDVISAASLFYFLTEIRFAVEIKGSNIPLLRQLLDQGLKLESRDLGNFLEGNIETYSNPRPIFETTYLSDSIRISRDQDGKVFVYGKVSGDTSPTDYSSVDSDFGVARLLEGFNDAITRFYL